MARRSCVAIGVAFVILVLFAYNQPFEWSTTPSSPPLDAQLTTSESAPELTSPTTSPLIQEPPAVSVPSPSPYVVTKVSMLYGSYKFSQLIGALETHRRHCERWNCGFETLEQDLTDRRAYSKHYFLLSTMLHELSKPPEDRTQWLMWVDADSMIVNPALSPSIFLPPDQINDVFALVTKDHQGLNNGVFFLKVSKQSVDLLTQTMAYPLDHPDEDLGWFGEQAAMANVINSTETQAESESRSSGIAWVPREWFNTYEFETGFEGKPGHFMVHFAGLAETRISHMGDWLHELQQNQEKWEIPIEETFYQAAVPHFWKEYAGSH